MSELMEKWDEWDEWLNTKTPEDVVSTPIELGITIGPKYFDAYQEERLKLCMYAFLAEYRFQETLSSGKSTIQLDNEIFQIWHKWATLYTKEAEDEKPNPHNEHWLL